MDGYNFTERTRKVIALAREEAVALRHEYIGTEHILLALIREGEGVACTVLANLSVELDELRLAVIAAVKPGKDLHTGPDLPFSSRGKKVLELSMSEAREVHHSYVGTEHVLLGLLREEKGLAAQILRTFKVETVSARAEMLRILGTEDGASPPRLAGLPNYSARLTEILNAAQEVAARRRAPAVAELHVAIALLEHNGGVANGALDRLGLNRADAVAALLELARMGDSTIGADEVEASTALTNVLHLMEQLQREARATPPNTYHLLAAILMTTHTIAAVFEAQKIDLARIRDEVRRISG